MRLISVGSALGVYVRAYRAAGIDAVGCDPFAPACPEESRFQWNIVTPEGLASACAAGPWDVVECLEVIEHIPPWQTAAFVSALAVLAGDGAILFTGAVPGQGGEGHCNLRPRLEWDAFFAEVGFAEDVAATERFVTHIQTTCPHYLRWLTNNAAIYRPVGALMHARIEAEEAVQAEWIAKWLLTFR
jgi:2-polyprenyl-3-methyl-5-hydroxy-6-metoxy-1,4-benzoquinol methylase